MKRTMPFYSGQDDETGLIDHMENFMKNHEHGSKNDNIEVDFNTMEIIMHFERRGKEVDVFIPYYEIKPEIEHYLGTYPNDKTPEEDYIGLDSNIRTEELSTLYTVDYDHNNKPVKLNSDLNDEDIPYGEEIFSVVDDTIKSVLDEKIMEPKARVAYLMNPDETEKLFKKGALSKETISFTGDSAMEVYYGKVEPTKFLVDTTIDHDKKMIKGLDENSKALGEEGRKTITFIEYNNQATSNIEGLVQEHESLNTKNEKKRKFDSPSI